jgi:glycosyltransferase involved in cell wall biosynthesis
MHVLTIAIDYLPNIGGISNHIFYLNKYLLKHSIKASILQIVQNSSKEHLLLEEVKMNDNKVHRLYIKDTIAKLNKIKYKKILKKILDENFQNIDIIHTHEFKTVEYLIPKNIKWVWTNHTSAFFAFANSVHIKDKILLPIVKSKFNKADAVITVSNLFYNKTKEIINNKNIYMIPNGIELIEYNDNKETFNLPNEKLKILIPARWSEVKGIHVILQLLDVIHDNTKYENLVFVFAGSDTFDDEIYYQNMKNKVSKLKNIILLGNIESSAMYQLYKEVDIVLIPSLFESASIVVLEAMNSKKIILASNVGGIPELIKDNLNGFLFEKENVIELKIKLDYILENFQTDEMDCIVNNAYDFCIQNYDWNKIALKTIDVYENVLKENG